MQPSCRNNYAITRRTSESRMRVNRNSAPLHCRPARGQAPPGAAARPGRVPPGPRRQLRHANRVIRAGARRLPRRAMAVRRQPRLRPADWPGQGCPARDVGARLSGTGSWPAGRAGSGPGRPRKSLRGDSPEAPDHSAFPLSHLAEANCAGLCTRTLSCNSVTQPICWLAHPQHCNTGISSTG